MSSFWRTLVFLAFAAACVSGTNPETTAYPNIPSHLIECYMNEGIYHRAFRMPSTFDNFLDLLRKVESSPTSRNLNARELSMVLLHYLKLDGIQSFQNHARTSSDILPFAPSGDEYFKHRLTLIGLVPRIDQSYLRAVNETLSTKEMCNLHFMLSYSIDPYKRDNERCSSLSEEERSLSQMEPKSEWNPYQTINRYYPNRNRHVRSLDKLGKRSKRHLRKSLRKREIEELQKLLQKRTLESFKKGSKFMSNKEIKMHEKELGKIQQMLRRRRRSTNKKDIEKTDVEELPSNHPNVQKGSSNLKKDKFTVGHQELLSGSEHEHSKKLQSIVEIQPRFGGRSYPRNGYSSDDSVYSGLVPGVPTSDCPVVNGIITSPYGPLAIGTVIAGIAAGLNPEEIPPVKLSVNPSEMETPSDRINNVWAVTLAGSVADILSSSALLEIDNLQVLKGGWNDTTDPRWYLLKNNQFKHMTEVALRGSLDGLFLGLNAKEFTNKFPSFKLSQMLQIYYDFLWGTVGAKNRVQLRPQYAPDEIFRKQVYLMSLVLKKQKTNVVTVLDYKSIAREAVARVTNFIQNMDYRSMMTTNDGGYIDNSVNFVAVVDSSWGFENLKAIFDLLRDYEVAAVPMQSNLTVFCGYDGAHLFFAENAIDLYNQFKEEQFFQNCSRGLNIPKVLENLELHYRKIYYDEKNSNQVNKNAQVVALFFHENYITDDKDFIETISKEFLGNFPDVRLMVASANGRPDIFNNIVRDPKDIFSLIPPTTDPSYRTIKDFANAVKQSYQRVSRPSCGSYFDDDTVGTEVRFTHDVFPGSTVFYRLLPQYYFKSSGDVIISIRSRQRSPITVCYSREVERPENRGMRREPIPLYPNSEYNPNYNPNYNPKPNDYKFGRQSDSNDGPVQCKTITGEEFKIEMNNPCDGASNLADCQPLYISIYSPLSDTTPTPCPTCRLPINVAYEISAVGLACYNRSASLLSNPLTIISALVLVLFKVRLL